MRDNGGEETYALRCVEDLLPKILPPTGRIGSSDPSGVVTCQS